MTSIRRCFTVVLMASALSLSVSDAHAADVQEREPNAQPDVFGFDYTKRPVPVTAHLESELETEHYRVHALSFPSVGENGQRDDLVTALYYESKHPGRKKLVIVLPIWGTHTYPPRKMTASLLNYSEGRMNVLRILGEDYLFDWEGMNAAADEEEFATIMHRMAQRVRTQVIDMRRAVDWAETQPAIDTGRIALIGFSMSANIASVVLANEPRIAAAALVMGGANPHEMFAACFGRAKALRDNITTRFGWTKETYKNALEGPFAPVNPTRFAGKVESNRVIIFDAEYDTCIPKSSRDDLWEAMGKPTRITWPSSHKMAFLMMSPLGLNTMRRQIYNFVNTAFVSNASTTAALSHAAPAEAN